MIEARHASRIYAQPWGWTSPHGHQATGAGGEEPDAYTGSGPSSCLLLARLAPLVIVVVILDPITGKMIELLLGLCTVILLTVDLFAVGFVNLLMGRYAKEL